MTPNQARDRFGEYFEGELSEDDAGAMKALLAEDAELREEYADFQGFMGMTAKLGDEPVGQDVDLLSGVQTKLRQRSGGRFYKDRFSEKSGSGGLTMPLILVGITLFVLVVAYVSLHYVQLEAPEPTGSSEVGE